MFLWLEIPTLEALFPPIVPRFGDREGKNEEGENEGGSINARMKVTETKDGDEHNWNMMKVSE